MDKAQKLSYKNILGDTKRTIDAIQKFIEEYSVPVKAAKEEMPADSVNRVINSIKDEDTQEDINKIIRNL